MVVWLVRYLTKLCKYILTHCTLPLSLMQYLLYLLYYTTFLVDEEVFFFIWQQQGRRKEACFATQLEMGVVCKHSSKYKKHEKEVIALN